MPCGQIPSFGEPPVGAGSRQPAGVIERPGFDNQAIGHPPLAVGVIGASAGIDIEQATRDPRVIDAAVVLVFELVQTAPATAVAQRLPLLRAHLFQRSLSPEARAQWQVSGLPPNLADPLRST